MYYFHALWFLDTAIADVILVFMIHFYVHVTWHMAHGCRKSDSLHKLFMFLFVVDTAALDDCDTAMSLCQFLTQENEAIGKLIDQLHSPPPTPVSNASSVQRCQPPVKIKQEPIDVSNTCIAPLPALYVMQTHPSSLFYVSSLANAATDMPTATATQEIEVKNELPPCSGNNQKHTGMAFTSSITSIYAWTL